jgi:hypothetical protein
MAVETITRRGGAGDSLEQVPHSSGEPGDRAMKQLDAQSVSAGSRSVSPGIVSTPD